MPADIQPLDAFAEMCREAGLKATHQRLEIYRELIGNGEHPDAETVWRRVRERLPSLSLDTVYRTLRTFEEKGLISRVGSTGDRTRFDSNTAHHHHFFCLRCGRIVDIASDELDRLAIPPEVSSIGTVDGVYVELRGCCENCRKAGGDRADCPRVIS